MIGSEVLAHKEKYLNKRIGPFKILDVDRKMIHVDIDGTNKLLSIDKFRTNLRPTTSDLPNKQTQLALASGKTEGAPNSDILDELRSILG